MMVAWLRNLTLSSLIALALILGSGWGGWLNAPPLARVIQLVLAQPGLAQAVTGPRSPEGNSSIPYETVDFVPQQYRLGQSLYRETCASCHLAIPPQVLPSESWLNLIQDSSHYGVTLPPLRDPSRGLIWSYLRYASRQRSSREARTPYRVARSQYFRALHPQVDLPRPVTLATCQSCHPAAAQFNFRQLAPAWREDG